MKQRARNAPSHRGLYLLHVSIHGRFRSVAPEIGVDADTGGQTKYVLELLRRLGKARGMHRVELLTRKISDIGLSADYAKDVEVVTDRSRIVRLPCGPEGYLPKEQLWPYLQEFIDNALRYIRDQGEVPDAIHGHYADGGFVATRIAKILGIPVFYTAHSLGRFKRERILSEGMSPRVSERKFHFRERIEAEEETLENAELVIASTNNEVETQYARYDHYDKDAMRVLPPGCDIEKLRTRPSASTLRELRNIGRQFLAEPARPALIVIARPDAQKNTSAAIHTFGRSNLRNVANLYLFIGLRNDLESVSQPLRDLYMEMFKLIDLYDLHGSVAYPKTHSPELVTALYQHARNTRGVSLALSKHENFGLTLVEAAAAGVPVVSSGAGGMRDVMKNCGHGLTVDPENFEEAAQAISDIIADQAKWRAFSAAGKKNVARFYAWPRHIKNYLGLVKQFTPDRRAAPSVRKRVKQFATARHYLVCDIDDTLTGDDRSMRQLTDLINDRDDILFGIATGRNLQSARAFIEENRLPDPSLLITSVGTRIDYNFGRVSHDLHWDRHIQFRWQPHEIRNLLSQIDWLEPQEPETQSHDKISYYLDRPQPSAARAIKTLLRKSSLQARVVVSRNRCVDVLPVRASKGHALRYVSWRFGIDMSHVLTAGDSGNDIDMLRGLSRGIVVGNYSKEVGVLRKSKDVYFSAQANAAGVLDGLKHYGV
ncbi:MAG: HAD-IIB family hydrolase [Rhizobiales bacterium]|nr:HAD-IIB family hydrolase [Hyphomicrobiales bacterium]